MRGSGGEDLIGPSEAASIFGVSALTVSRWGKTRLVPTVVLPNGRRMFSRAYCQDYMADRQVAYTPPSWQGAEPAS